jgi:hypothetical protein
LPIISAKNPRKDSENLSQSAGTRILKYQISALSKELTAYILPLGFSPRERGGGGGGKGPFPEKLESFPLTSS